MAFWKIFSHMIYRQYIMWWLTKTEKCDKLGAEWRHSCRNGVNSYAADAADIQKMRCFVCTDTASRKGNRIMTAEEISRFEAAKNKIIGQNRDRNGIGTLSEKTVHAVLKHYYAPEEDMHEIPVESSVADIYTGNEIIEIQTRSFNRMRGKLERFLPLCPVTIVYPIPYVKHLYWIDEESGEISGGRKSPLQGNPYMAFPELYKIKMFLKDPNLRIRLAFLNMEEYKLLNGWSRDKKKGSSRFDRIPTSMEYEMEFGCIQDYVQLLPYELEEPFTAQSFGRAVRIKKELAGVVCHVLHYLGVIEQAGKKGNAYLYRVKEF